MQNNNTTQLSVNNIRQVVNDKAIMSSREIAELTKKQHKDVLRDCRKMFEELTGAERKVGCGYSDKNNRERTEYLLTEEEVYTLLMGYSTRLRAEVIYRLYTLLGKTFIPPNDEGDVMSSREIAELTGKSHFHVLRDCKKMFKALAIEEINYSSYYLDKNNQERLEYFLPEEESLILTTGYSTEQRHRVASHWINLEKEAPSHEFYLQKAMNHLFDISGTVTTTSVAKKLGMTTIALNEFLRDAGVKFLSKDFPKAGYEKWFKVRYVWDQDTTVPVCRITGRGEVEIIALWYKHQAIQYALTFGDLA